MIYLYNSSVEYMQMGIKQTNMALSNIIIG